MYSIMASRDRALRSAALECWPEGTVHTRDDVVINGSSLVQIASAGPTPAVRIGTAGGLRVQQPSPRRFITVVLTRVEQIGYSEATRRSEIWVDAELDRCRPILTAARIVGRESTARQKRMHLRPQPATGPGWVRMPVDIAVGDLIVVPCDGTTPLGDVRRRDHHPERLNDDRTDPAEDDFPYLPSCLK